MNRMHPRVHPIFICGGGLVEDLDTLYALDTLDILEALDILDNLDNLGALDQSITYFSLLSQKLNILVNMW